MTVAPYLTTMKNLHPLYRPLPQPLSSLYRQPFESHLLYAPRLKHGRLPQSTYSIERHGRDEHVVDSFGQAKTKEGEAGARRSFAQINYCLVQCLESFNDWGGRGYDDSVPGVVNETAPSGYRAA